MRICVVGAGAIGGLMGAKLALSGQEVTLIDQGAHRAAIKENGLKLVMEDGAELLAKDVKATDSFDEAGTQDMVILALKAHQIEAVAPKLPALFDADTSIVTVQNGLPWWYFQRHGGEFDGRRLETLDPTGVIEANIEAERIIGCVVYPAAAVIEPGVIHHFGAFAKLVFGEIDNQKSERVLAFAEACEASGIEAEIPDDTQVSVWLKFITLASMSGVTSA